MASLTSNLPHAQTLTSKDLEKFWGDKADPHSIRNIVSSILSGLKAANERGELPRVKWSLCGSCVVNQFIAPIFRRVHDKDFKLVFVVPLEDKIEVFHRIREVLAKSLEFLPRDKFNVTRTSYTMQNPNLSFSVCRVAKIHDPNALPLEIAIELISHPDVRMHVLNLDSAEITGPDVLPEDDEIATYYLRSKEVQEGDLLEPVLEDIRNHLISSSVSLENAATFSRGEWPRYIFSITDGALEKDLNTNLYFFLGVQEFGSDLVRQFRHWIRQKRNDIPNYECYAIINALNHCISPKIREKLFLDLIEKKPQELIFWIQSKLYLLKRLEKQLPVLKGIIKQFEENCDPIHFFDAMDRQAPEILKQFLEGEDLRSYFIAYLKSLVKDKNLVARSEILSRELENNLSDVSTWLKDNLLILKNLEKEIPILKEMIERFEETLDAKILWKSLQEQAPEALKICLQIKNKIRPRFIIEYQNLIEDQSLEENMRGTWLSFLRKWAEIPMSDTAFLEGIHRFLPLFADEVHLKKHLQQTHLQCVFKHGQEKFYIPVPLLSQRESEKFSVVSNNQDVALLGPIDESLRSHPQSHFFIQDESSLTKVSQEKAAAQNILQSANEENISVFANRLLFSQMLTLEQIEALLPLASLSPLQMKNLIRQIFTMYPHQKMKASLSEKLLHMVSMAIAEEEDKKPWQALYIFLVLSFPFEQDMEKSRFLWALENMLGSFALSQFPKLIPDMRKMAIYSVKKHLLLQPIAPERALLSLRNAFEDQKLKENLEEIWPDLRKMEDPFRFHETYQRFSQAKERLHQLALLSLQGALLGYEIVISLYPKLYEESSMPIKDRVEASCLVAVEHLLQHGSVDQMFMLYKHCNTMPLVASAIENHLALTGHHLLKYISQLEPNEKKLYLSIFLSRIPKMPIEQAEIFIPYLPTLGIKQQDLEVLCLSLYKQDERFALIIHTHFPYIIEPLFTRLRSCNEKIFLHKFATAFPLPEHSSTRKDGWDLFVKEFESLVKLYEAPLLVEIGKRYLLYASPEEKSDLAFTCAVSRPFIGPASSLFHLAVDADFSVSFWKSRPWTPALVQSAWHIMKDKTQKQKEDFVEIAVGVVPYSKDYKILWQEMSSYWSETSLALFINTATARLKELEKANKQEETGSYLSFLSSLPDLSSHLARDFISYSAFLKTAYSYALSANRDRDFTKNLAVIMKFLGDPSILSHFSEEENKEVLPLRVSLGFASLKGLQGQGSASHKMNTSWLAEDVIRSLDNPNTRKLLKENNKKYPEFASVFLERFIPLLKDSIDLDWSLSLVHDLLTTQPFLSVESLFSLSSILKEMYAQNEDSFEVFLCSKQLLALAAKSKQEQIVEDLIESIHIKRVRKAIETSSDTQIALELSAVTPFLLMSNQMQCSQQIISPIVEYSLDKMSHNLGFLKVFEDRRIESSEMSLFVVYLIASYMRRCENPYQPMPIAQLCYHLEKLSPDFLEGTSCYAKLHDLASSFLSQCDASFLQEQLKRTDISDSAEWSHQIADDHLSRLSREFIKLFLARGLPEDREKVKELVKSIHLERLRFFSYIRSRCFFADLDAYCLYLENIIPLDPSSELLPSSILVGALNTLLTTSPPQLDFFINRIIDASWQFCLRSRNNFTGFCLSMGALEILSRRSFFPIIEAKYRSKIIPLLEYAYSCDWEGKGAKLFLERFAGITASNPGLITDEWVFRSLNKACSSLKKMVIPEEIEEIGLYQARVISQILEVGNNAPKFIKSLEELLIKVLIELGRVSQTSMDSFFEEFARAFRGKNIREEFQKYCKKNLLKV